MVIHDDELWRNLYNVDRTGNSLPKQGVQQSFIISKQEYKKLEKRDKELIDKDNQVWDKLHDTYIQYATGSILRQESKGQGGIRVSKHTYSKLVKKDPDLKRHFNKSSYPICSAVLSETQESFKIGNKTFEELSRLHIGYNHEPIPRLEEVLMTISDYNTREKGGNLIINIELKDEDAGVLALKTCNKYVDSCRIKWKDIIFCSFKHKCLQNMVEYNRENKLAKPLQLAPSIKTATLFNKENVDPKTFRVLKGANYSKEGLEYLENLVKDKEWVAYDAVVWDIKQQFIDLVKQGNKTTPQNKKALHLSTSDYRIFNNKKLCDLLIKAAQDVPIFFKTDEPRVMRSILEKHQKAYKEKGLEREIESIRELLRKPPPFSKIPRNRRAPWIKQRTDVER